MSVLVKSIIQHLQKQAKVIEQPTPPLVSDEVWQQLIDKQNAASTAARAQAEIDLTKQNMILNRPSPVEALGYMGGGALGGGALGGGAGALLGALVASKNRKRGAAIGGALGGVAGGLAGGAALPLLMELRAQIQSQEKARATADELFPTYRVVPRPL